MDLLIFDVLVHPHCRSRMLLDHRVVLLYGLFLAITMRDAIFATPMTLVLFLAFKGRSSPPHLVSRSC